MAKFPFFQQHDMMDCGPTCIRMIAAHYGKQYSLQHLREISYIDREGVSARGIVEAAEHIGLQTISILVPLNGDDEIPGLEEDVPLPAIAHWKQEHFVVVYKITKKYVYIADPADGKRKIPKSLFKKNWQSDGDKGIIIVAEPTPEFYAAEGVKTPKTGFKFLFRYLRPYRKLILQLLLGLLLGSLIQLIFPFLTQSVVDIGIQNQDINFIYLILAAQLMLFLSQMAATFIQNWILLHISTRVNVNLISDFLSKIMRLPVGYFDTKMIGDLLQRIGDHRRIELFLTNSTLNVIFSAFNIVVFSVVLAIYSWTIFGIFIVGSILYVLWITIFLERRAQIDYQKFTHNADNQSELIELIQGMQEIKLQNSELKHRWKWMDIQAKLFKANIRSLQITQYQDVGAGFINQLKDILITFFFFFSVIEGSIIFCMLVAIQYIMGQMKGPLQQMVLFLRTAQDAKLSLERLGEIHSKENEEEDRENRTDVVPIQQ
ncbi:MAG: cysteine peptidase family C39 domain-containing protein, partial [Saprospiraceae bacterium]